MVGELREADLLKPPGIAETIDWTQALHVLGADRLDGDPATATLGAAVKYHEDQMRVAARHPAGAARGATARDVALRPTSGRAR